MRNVDNKFFCFSRSIEICLLQHTSFDFSEGSCVWGKIGSPSAISESDGEVRISLWAILT
jgi:hypothetical protein